MSVAIVDYGMGNLDSVARAVQECDADAVICSSPERLEGSTHVILPGVGAFSRGIANIRDRGFDLALDDLVRRQGVPCLGLCLGMQLLADSGSEGGDNAGLGWIAGRVRRLEPVGEGERIPHVGWDEITPERADTLLDGIPAGSDFFFTHSFAFECKDEGDLVATTPYCGGFASIVGRQNVRGVQFHPEKSQRVGLRLLRNFLGN